MVKKKERKGRKREFKGKKRRKNYGASGRERGPTVIGRERSSNKWTKREGQ